MLNTRTMAVETTTDNSVKSEGYVDEIMYIFHAEPAVVI